MTVIEGILPHELGHGAFHLKHLFDEDELGTSFLGSTQNVMDYSANKEELYLHQWNYINDPASVSWFDGDDDQALNEEE